MEKEVTKERIEAFLNGYNPMEHITNIECGYNDDKVSIIFDGKDGHRKIKQDDFKPFCWVKRSACIRMYNGDRSKLKWALNKAGIRIKELRSKDENGNEADRLKNGYKFLFYSTVKTSYSAFMRFFQYAGTPIYSKNRNESTQEKEFLTCSPVEQYMISTGTRLFKGYENYDDVKRLVFDLETGSLNPRVSRITLNGIRTNKGFETILEVTGKTKEEYDKSELDDDCKNCHNYLIENEYFERDIDISDFEYETYNEGYQLNITGYYEITTDNGFLIYDRTCNGYTVDTWKQGDNLTLYGIKKEYKGNLFIYMNRTCTGYTIDNINELEINKEADYDYQKDLYRNAFALQITDDGRIGYRYLTKNCDATSADTIQYQILSGFSSSGLVKNDKWYTINVRVISLNDNMKLYFYINGKLKFISKELPKFNFKSLNEIY